MKKILCVIALLAVMLSLCAVTVSANSAVYPDIIIKLDPSYEGDYYVAVLSDRNAFDAWNEKDDYLLESDYMGAQTLAALKKLRGARDEDGYIFIADLDCFNKVNGDTDVVYPYDTFKIALYFPDTDTLVKTDILKKESYIEVFKLSLDGKKIANIQTAEYNTTTNTEGEYHPAVTTDRPIITKNIIKQFFICLAFNLVVEILIGLLFGYRKWKHILTIAVTNIITLILLTVSTILINPPVYDSLLSFPFALFEIAVAAVEGTVYAVAFRRFDKSKKFRPWLAVLYAFVANALTYVIGSLFYLIPH